VALFVDGPENDAAEGTGAPGPGESGRHTRDHACPEDVMKIGVGRTGPVASGRTEVLVGGFAPAALARVARCGDGLLCAAPPALTA
jgi:hypothetical protein